MRSQSKEIIVLEDWFILKFSANKVKSLLGLYLEQTFRELIPKELNCGINSNFLELRLELNLFLKIWNWNYLIPLKNGFNSNSGNYHKNFTFTENLSSVDTSLSMLSYFPRIKSLYRKYNTILLSSAKFQSLSLAVGQLGKLTYLSTVRKLYLTGIRIGIGVNSHQDFGIRIGIKSKK